MSHYDQGAEVSATFRAYAQRFDLSLLDVALAAQVRLLTVWKIENGLPVREVDALAVRTGLYRLTGIPYIGRMPLIPTSNLVMPQVSSIGDRP